VKLLALIFAVAAMGADLKVDHITVAGSDLEKLQQMVGIKTEFGGKHSNGQTEMALASFADGSYLELIAPQPGADASAHYWSPFMLKNGGPCAWAIRSSDIAADMARLKSAGVEVRSQRNGRTRPDGVELKWETVDAGPASPGSFFPFLIHDETPRERRVYPSGKPTLPGISGVLFVAVAVRDLDAAIAKYRAAFGLPEPKTQNDRAMGATLAWFPGSPVILAAATEKDGWVAARLAKFGEAPCAFVLADSDLQDIQSTKWFSHPIRWIDPHLPDMRIGMSP
jgi:glyoxalase-like protein